MKTWGGLLEDGTHQTKIGTGTVLLMVQKSGKKPGMYKTPREELDKLIS